MWWWWGRRHGHVKTSPLMRSDVWPTNDSAMRARAHMCVFNHKYVTKLSQWACWDTALQLRLKTAGVGEQDADTSCLQQNVFVCLFWSWTESKAKSAKAQICRRSLVLGLQSCMASRGILFHFELLMQVKLCLFRFDEYYLKKLLKNIHRHLVPSVETRVVFLLL